MTNSRVQIGKSTAKCQLYSPLKIPQEVSKSFVPQSVPFPHWLADTPWCHNPGKITHTPDVAIVRDRDLNMLFLAPRMQIWSSFER